MNSTKRKILRRKRIFVKSWWCAVGNIERPFDCLPVAGVSNAAADLSCRKSISVHRHSLRVAAELAVSRWADRPAASVADTSTAFLES